MSNEENSEQERNPFEEQLSMSAVKVASIQIHELFLSLQEAGFSHTDALTIVAKLVSDAASSSGE